MIDSNVLVSGVIFRLSLPRRAVDFAFEHDSVLSSSATRNELREVFRRAKFDPYCPLDQRLEYLEDIIEEMTPVSIVETVRGSRDAKDDKF